MDVNEVQQKNATILSSFIYLGIAAKILRRRLKRKARPYPGTANQFRQRLFSLFLNPA